MYHGFLHLGVQLCCPAQCCATAAALQALLAPAQFLDLPLSNPFYWTPATSTQGQDLMLLVSIQHVGDIPLVHVAMCEIA